MRETKLPVGWVDLGMWVGPWSALRVGVDHVCADTGARETTVWETNDDGRLLAPMCRAELLAMLAEAQRAELALAAPKPKADDHEWGPLGVNSAGAIVRAKCREAREPEADAALIAKMHALFESQRRRCEAENPPEAADPDWIPLGVNDVLPEGWQFRRRSEGTDAAWKDGDVDCVGVRLTLNSVAMFEYRAPRPKPEPAEDADGWRWHDGIGGCPVDPSALVQVQYRGDTQRLIEVAGYFEWAYVRRYRILVPEAQLRRDAESKARRILDRYFYPASIPPVDIEAVAKIILGEA